MRRLNKNHWRRGWVLLVNGTVAALQLTAPIRSYNDQRMLHEAMRTALPAYSYWKSLFDDPWVPILAAILLAGIVAELFRSAVSPILNLAPFTFWLVLILREQSSGEHIILLFPLVIVIAAELVFYAFAFRRQESRTSGG